MFSPKLFLREEIDRALRRYRRSLMVRGGALVLLAVSFPLALLYILRAHWETTPWLIPLLCAVAFVAGLYTSVAYFILPMRRRITRQQVARTIESQNPDLEDRLATAVDQLQHGEHPWLPRLIQDAVRYIENREIGRQLQITGYGFWRIAFVLAILLLAALLWQKSDWAPELEKIARAGFVPPRPLAELQVAPGDAEVQKGASLEIQATVQNFTPAQAKLFYTSNDAAWETVDLTPAEGSQQFSYRFFDIQDTLKYYVKADEEISDIYTVRIYDAPSLRRLELTYFYPKASGLKVKTERDGGDISAPVGTRVRVRAISSLPINAAELLVGENQRLSMNVENDTTASGNLRILGDGFYRVRIVSPRGLENAPLVEYYIHAVQNKPPAVTIRKPMRDMRATMLEEVPVIAEVSDDFGLKSVQLAVIVNDRPVQKFSMQKVEKDQPAGAGIEYETGEYAALIYLEDLKVEPGDFLTYTVEATDIAYNEPAVSEMYFVEVSNFEMIYILGASQQQGGASGMGGPSLSSLQKDIITATTRILYNRLSLAGEELKSEVQNLSEAQSSVRSMAERMRSSMFMRLGRAGAGKRMQQELEMAINAMKNAERLLQADSLRSALGPERRAYNHLLRVESFTKERQITQSRSMASAWQNRQEDLRQLFQDELDKLQSKYETLQQGDRRQNEKMIDEAIQKIQELARRQQALNELNRELAQKNLTPEQKRREIQKLQRQQEQLRRDTEKSMEQLARNMRNQQRSSRETMQRLQRASNEMSQASRNLRKQQSESALARGQQALDRLRQLEQSLKKNQENARKDQLADLQQKLQRMAEKQARLAQQSDSLSRMGPEAADRLYEHIQNQARLRQKAEQAMTDLNELARDFRDNEAMQKELQGLHRELSRARIPDRMQQSETALALGRAREAERLQRRAERSLSQGAEKLRSAVEMLENADDASMELALREAQNLRRNLEKELEKMQQGRETQTGDPSQQKRKSQTQSAGEGNPETGSVPLTPEMLQDWRELLWQTERKLREMEEAALNRDAGLADRSRDLRQIISGFLRNFRGGDPLRLEFIKERLVDPLRRLEAELATQLELQQTEDALRSVREANVPQEFRDYVEEYYRSLSKGSK